MASNLSPSEKAERAWGGLRRLDQQIRATLGRMGIPLLRISLGIVFIWFGVLKITGETPVTELVAKTVYWVDPDWFVPFLGVIELLVGIGLLFNRALRVVLFLFIGQMLGTFLVLVLEPQVAFQDGNPFLLTVEGEFVIKNLVLLSAGLVVGSHVPPLPDWRSIADSP
jgi:putative oxidoreductase